MDTFLPAFALNNGGECDDGDCTINPMQLYYSAYRKKYYFHSPHTTPPFTECAPPGMMYGAAPVMMAYAGDPAGFTAPPPPPGAAGPYGYPMVQPPPPPGSESAVPVAPVPPPPPEASSAGAAKKPVTISFKVRSLRCVVAHLHA